MKYSQYTIIARLFPALITALPLMILYFYYLDSFLIEFINSFLILKIFGDFTAIAAITYLYSQLNRFLGKIIEDKVFNDENMMPTTELLLWSNNKYSSEFKSQMKMRIHRDFTLNLFTPEEEYDDEQGARAKIVEAIALIRTKTRNSELLLQHNYEYGFIRNLVGGSLFGLIISLVNLWIFLKMSYYEVPLNLSIGLAVIFSVLLIVGIPLIKYMGYKYAKVLIHEYFVLGNK